MPRTGRPSSYTPEWGEKVCEEISAGVPLRKIQQKPGMPSAETIYRWLLNNDDFYERYARAKRCAGHACAEKVLETVDKVEAGEIDDRSGMTMIKGLQWAAERLAPRVYGTQVNHDLGPNTTLLIKDLTGANQERQERDITDESERSDGSDDGSDSPT